MMKQMQIIRACHNETILDQPLGIELVVAMTTIDGQFFSFS
jgi:hypothetical protein